MARLRAPIDDPATAEFVANLVPVNERADSSPGFVWRLQDATGDATGIDAFDDPTMIVNLSVWESVEALKAFAYKGMHRDVFRRRAEWFVAPDHATAVLWWVPAGHVPTISEARQRLEFRRRNGPTPYGFDMAKPDSCLWFERASLDDPAAQDLIGELNAELAAEYPAPGANHFGLTADEIDPRAGTFIVGRLDGVAVACGALRSIAPGFGELKRMYTAPLARGCRIAEATICELENHARAIGLSELCLETGHLSRGAIRLYERNGFERCAAWGEYILTPASSYCMRKSLAE